MRSGTLWRLLNSNFVLWLLSSILIASFVSLNSASERCYATAKTYLPKLVQSASERDLRVTTMDRIVAGSEPLPAVHSQVHDLIKGSTYFYRENKGKSMLDLEFDIIRSALELSDVGLKKPLNVTGFTSRSAEEILNEFEAGTLNEERLAEWRRIAKTSTGPRHIVSSSFPFTLEETKDDLHGVLFEQSPCNPFYLVRDRLKQLFGFF